eukprot:COSAG02_NODE_35_length_49339_cov_20.375102_15_plen_1443_part_00
MSPLRAGAAPFIPALGGDHLAFTNCTSLANYSEGKYDCTAQSLADYGKSKYDCTAQSLADYGEGKYDYAARSLAHYSDGKYDSTAQSLADYGEGKYDNAAQSLADYGKSKYDCTARPLADYGEGKYDYAARSLAHYSEGKYDSTAQSLADYSEGKYDRAARSLADHSECKYDCTARPLAHYSEGKYDCTAQSLADYGEHDNAAQSLADHSKGKYDSAAHSLSEYSKGKYDYAARSLSDHSKGKYDCTAQSLADYSDGNYGSAARSLADYSKGKYDCTAQSLADYGKGKCDCTAQSLTDYSEGKYDYAARSLADYSKGKYDCAAQSLADYSDGNYGSAACSLADYSEGKYDCAAQSLADYGKGKYSTMRFHPDCWSPALAAASPVSIEQGTSLAPEPNRPPDNVQRQRQRVHVCPHLRKVGKKLAQIERLQVKQASGADLDEQQLTKLAQQADLRARKSLLERQAKLVAKQVQNCNVLGGESRGQTTAGGPEPAPLSPPHIEAAVELGQSTLEFFKAALGDREGQVLSMRCKEAGFDSVDEILAAGLSETDLRELGVVQMEPRRIILRLLTQLAQQLMGSGSSRSDDDNLPGHRAGPWHLVTRRKRPRKNMGVEATKLAEELEAHTSEATSKLFLNDLKAYAQSRWQTKRGSKVRFKKSLPRNHTAPRKKKTREAAPWRDYMRQEEFSLITIMGGRPREPSRTRQMRRRTLPQQHDLAWKNYWGRIRAIRFRLRQEEFLKNFEKKHRILRKESRRESKYQWRLEMLQQRQKYQWPRRMLQQRRKQRRKHQQSNTLHDVDSPQTETKTETQTEVEPKPGQEDTWACRVRPKGGRNSSQPECLRCSAVSTHLVTLKPRLETREPQQRRRESMPAQASSPDRGNNIHLLNDVQLRPLEQHPDRTEHREGKERVVLGTEGSGIRRYSVRLDRVELAALVEQTPDDVWAGIASSLTSPRDLAALSCTSRRFCRPVFKSFIAKRVQFVVQCLQMTHGFTTAMPIDVEFTNRSSSSLQLHAVSANTRRSRAAVEPEPEPEPVELAAGEWYDTRGFAGDEYHVFTQGGDLLCTIELERVHSNSQIIDISAGFTWPACSTYARMWRRHLRHGLFHKNVNVGRHAPVPAAVPAAKQTWLQLHAQLELFGTTPSSIVTEADHAAQLAQWLPCEAPKLRRLYCASEDGWGADQFHRRCDDKGPTLTVILDSQGYVFGGYTDCAWSSGGGGKRSPDAFLFALHCHGGLCPAKMALRDPKDPSAVYHDADCGPDFNDLYVALSPRSGCPRVNHHYRAPFGNHHYKSPLGKHLRRHKDLQAAEVEVFQVVANARDKAIPSLEAGLEAGHNRLPEAGCNLSSAAMLGGLLVMVSEQLSDLYRVQQIPSEHCVLRNGRKKLRNDRRLKRSRRSVALHERAAREDDIRRRRRHCHRGEWARLQRKTGQRARSSFNFSSKCG